ncbi:uncharacterized protein BO80DRAFT_361406 [Aspergillus ibericus CBS 121593]|uniref:Zinc finger PHD-type domain-containing protein n=1 Tax=Aspergillus ibericus CBS 121593 TaxID=1448316 RepID=A0A395GWV6_9EURO|nr:hypothetical protein BO80DRAFT_361406 [Aspergillus ibericus CBS 121593]RAK98533.1 hypothetical protein BO80DRAFT_361406 [Aspergillus ibericus CBS 121593]
MGCRGLWNLRVNGHWYRSCQSGGRINPPDYPNTLKTVKQLRDTPDKLDGWEKSPVPGPLHSNFDWVYTVDLDVGTLAVTFWDVVEDKLLPATVCFDLATVCQASSLSIDDLDAHPRYFPSDHVNGSSKPNHVCIPLGQLELRLGLPTPLNELQARFFIDFIFPWRYYIDDPQTWHYQSPVFPLITIALLRLAAWDLEVSPDWDVDLPIAFDSIPTWSYPEDTIYWFHRFLVVLHPNIESQAMLGSAVGKAQQYIENSTSRDSDVRLIIISPHHIAFAELSNNTVLSTSNLALLSDLSATHCSPGFRVLSRILTSDCWGKSNIHQETWQYRVPPEMLQLIMQKLEPRDAVALAQASFVAEMCYYSFISQFPGMTVRSFPLLIPCCGKRSGLEERGIMCTKCYAWQHADCINQESPPPGAPLICSSCRSGESSPGLNPGGIQRISRRKWRQGCQVEINGFPKLLQPRLLKPAHLRPALRFRGNIPPVPPELIDYTIRFNGTFSGLAYGVDDEA